VARASEYGKVREQTSQRTTCQDVAIGRQAPPTTEKNSASSAPNLLATKRIRKSRRLLMAGKNVFEITDGNFQDEVLDAELPVVIDFWAPWCGPCRAIAPLIEQLAERYDGKVKVGKLNVDDNPEVAQKYRITGIPSLIAFKDGEVVDQLVGANPKRINEIFAEIS